MSVWNNLLPNYKGELVYRMSKDVESDLLKRHIGLFNYTLKGSKSIFKDHVPGNRADMIRSKEDFYLDFQQCDKTDLYLYFLLKKSNNWKTGIEGCYSFYRDLHLEKKIECIVEHDHVREIASNVFKAMTMNSHFNMKDTFAFGDKFLETVNYKNRHLIISNTLKKIKNLRGLHSIKSFNKDVMLYGPVLKNTKSRFSSKNTNIDTIVFKELPSKLFATYSKFTVYFYKGFYFFVEEDKSKPSYIFLNKDFSRIINFADAMAGASFHAEYKEKFDNDSTESNFLNQFVKYIYSTEAEYLNVATEAWISAVKAIKCILAGPFAMEGYKQLVNERIAKGHEKVCKIEFMKNLVKGGSANDIVILGAVARVAMPPDFDVPHCFEEEKKLHMDKNKVGKEISEEAEKIYQGFLEYNRYAFINQYAKRYKIMPGAPYDNTTEFGERYIQAIRDKKRIKITVKEASQVNLKGVLKYKNRDKDYFMYFKDTAMARNTVSENMKDDYNKFEESNQIGHMLYTEEMLDIESYKKTFHEDDVEHPIRVGMKVESAKEDGRWFFIYNLKDKIIQSELEENVHEFLRFVPGNAVGKSSVDLKQLMLEVIQMEREKYMDIAPIFLSDDISKWSPHMSVRVQQDSANFWAEVFDEPWIRNIEKINLNDKVIVNIMGFKGKYNSAGANKEGASGKRFTYLMINLKAYATYILRGKSGGEKVIEGAVRLLTFLDDGFIQADCSLKNYKTASKKIIQGYSNIQKMCGYELKISKSYPSDRYLTFLNYEYVSKCRLYDELKSCVKLFVRKIGEVMTLPERIRECASWATGAAESGSDVGFVYYAYITRLVHEVQSWSKKPMLSNATTISQFLAPMPYGGFGVVPVHGIIAGLVRNLTSECLETMKRYAKVVAEAKPIYIKLVKTVLKSKRGVTILKTPTTVVSSCPHLTEHRITNKLEKTFLESSESPYLAEFIALSNRDELEDFADTIVSDNNRVAHASLELIYNCTTINFIDKILSKCKKSASLINILGQKILDSVVHANIAEANTVISDWVNYAQSV